MQPGPLFSCDTVRYICIFSYPYKDNTMILDNQKPTLLRCFPQLRGFKKIETTGFEPAVSALRTQRSPS